MKSNKTHRIGALVPDWIRTEMAVLWGRIIYKADAFVSSCSQTAHREVKKQAFSYLSKVDRD